MTVIVKISPSDPRALKLMEELDEYQSSLYPAESNHLNSVEELSKGNVCFLGAFSGNELCGIGAVKHLPDGYSEIKRLYVTKMSRGMGIGGLLLSVLENRIKESGVRVVRLETGVYQYEAIRFYESLDYKIIGPFGDYREDRYSIFMEKRFV